MPHNPLDLRHMLIPLLQRLVILQLLPLARALHTLPLRRPRAPEPDIAIVGTRHDVIVVGGEGGGEDALHALGGVDVARMALGAVPDAHAAVVARAHEFFAGGRESDVHDGGHVVFEDVEGAPRVAAVEEVDVVVFGREREVEGFHRVPGDTVAGEGEGGAREGG